MRKHKAKTESGKDAVEDLRFELQVLEDKLNDALERNAILHEDMTKLKQSLEAALGTLSDDPDRLRLRAAVMHEALLRVYDMISPFGYGDVLEVIDGGLGRTAIAVPIPVQQED